MTESNLSKICPKCKTEKPISEFHKDKSKKDGFCSACKFCIKEYHLDGKSRAYYIKNKDSIAVKKKKYYLKNKDKKTKYDKNYRAINKDKIVAKRNKYYEKHKKEILIKQREYYNANKLKKAEYDKDYRADNKNTLLDKKRKYLNLHKEEIKNYKKSYYESNKEELAIKNKEYREENKEKLAIKRKQYTQTEKGKAVIKKHHSKRKALKRGATVKDFSPIEIFERDGHICQNCKKKTRPDFKHTHPLYPHLDHIIPLSLGGNHSRKNVQCLCARCNLLKSNTGVGDQLRMFG